MGGKGSGSPKYTPEVHAKIVKALEAGCFKQHAARYAGIAYSTLVAWIKLGEDGVAPYAKLRDDVEHAIACDAMRNQEAINRAARARKGKDVGDWKAAAWNLEKKFPKLYGRLAELRLMRDDELARQKQAPTKPYSPWKQPGATQPPLKSAGRLDA